jgi:hypothetical protein
VPDPTPLCRPRLVVLDTAHLAGLVADIESDGLQRKRAAQRFVPDLVEMGWLPLLCWHHIEELLQHRDDQLVDARLRYLWSLPRMAWIQPSDPNAGPGSILEVLRAEAAAALRSPGADAIRVRDLVRDELIAVGTGADAIPGGFREWRLLRNALAHQQQNARRVAAIARWRATDIDDTRMGTWFNRPKRNLNDAARVLGHLRNDLECEIATRGDRRIPDAAAIATEFMQQVAQDGHAVVADREAAPAVQLLINAGLEPEEIDPLATFGETLDLLTFQKRLRMVTEGFNLPWAELKRRVTRQQLPVIVIEEAMRRHAQDQAERKGSELNDTHLLCLAPYADMTYVDKRTLENLRRVRHKCPVVDRLIGSVARATGHPAVGAMLARQ